MTFQEHYLGKETKFLARVHCVQFLIRVEKEAFGLGFTQSFFTNYHNLFGVI